jgi:hypothetical protein
MRLSRAIRENPFVILCAALVALLGWVATDLARQKPSKEARVPLDLSLPPSAPPLDSNLSFAPVRPGLAADEPITAMASRITVAMLPKLKAGMTRTQVESLIGAPTADQVQPVSNSGGRVTYRTAYAIDDLGTPMTIRPIQPRARPRPALPSADTALVVALEFDASLPGHPLVEIVFPDPLF